jgi:hypothetical protein
MKASIAESFVGLLKEMYILILIQPLVFVEKKDIVKENTTLFLSNISLYFIDLNDKLQKPGEITSYPKKESSSSKHDILNFFCFSRFFCFSGTNSTKLKYIMQPVS